MEAGVCLGCHDYLAMNQCLFQRWRLQIDRPLLLITDDLIRRIAYVFFHNLYLVLQTQDCWSETFHVYP